jgi:hypothetical protein
LYIVVDVVGKWQAVDHAGLGSHRVRHVVGDPIADMGDTGGGVHAAVTLGRIAD